MTAPDWRTRCDLREMKGRPRLRGPIVQRIDRHTADWRGFGKVTHDPRGFDVLEELAQYRRRIRSSAEPFKDFAAARYQELRGIAREKCRGLRHAEFLAGCAALAADARRLRAEVAQ